MKLASARARHFMAFVLIGLAFGSQTFAQPTVIELQSPYPNGRPRQPLQPPAVPATLVVSAAKVPEGTEVHVHLAEQLSSATASAGDTFAVISDGEITLPDGTVIPAGYSGKGEVTSVEKAGMIGKSGQLTVRLDYLKIGGAHIHLRANKGGEGKSGVTNTVVVTVLFGPLGLLVRGHTMVFPKGTRMTAYVDEDGQVSLPLAPPPTND